MNRATVLHSSRNSCDPDPGDNGDRRKANVQAHLGEAKVTQAADLITSFVSRRLRPRPRAMPL